MARVVALAVGFLLIVSRSPFALEPTLTVVWSDSRQLFPERGIDMLRDELQRLFQPHGIQVGLHVFRVGERLADLPEPRVQAIVTPSDGLGYALHRDAMAATIGDRGGSSNVFVFFPGVLRTLGFTGANFGPREGVELARAMARILAHEIVHVLAPERGHADSGLMAEQLERKDLVRGSIELDPGSARLARAQLRKGAPREPALAVRPRGLVPKPAGAPLVPDCMFQIS